MTIMQIEKLSPQEYRETAIGTFNVEGAYGPHTVLPAGDGYWIDYYTEKSTALAGIRRVKGRMK
ncbi:hypothetical protein GCM10009720_28020 [Yaniella flava]|uniref:Uncharacterized protein n=1 Tax=Yaniella flava TaxID=287930 RepID=A0ABP5GM46_9MICC